MDSGKTFLVVLVSVVSTYAAMTAWPALKELATAHPSPSVAAPGAVPQPQIVVASALPIPSPVLPTAAPNAPVGQAGHARGGAQPMDMSGLTPVMAAAVPWDNSEVKFARVSVTMRARPAGEAVVAISLNKEPLKILRGTRLMPVKAQGDWVMVQAPSAQLGWVRKGELTDERPIAIDHYTLR